MNDSSAVDVRLARASELLRDLHKDMQAYDDEGYVWCDPDLFEDKRGFTVWLRIDQYPPLQDYSLRMSEVVHHLRSGLNGLAWSLAVVNGVEPPNPRQVQFPIAQTEASWKGQAGTLTTIPPEYLERMRLVQPYLSDDPPLHPLATLHHISNNDKHRDQLISAAASVVDAYTPLAIRSPIGGALQQRQFAPDERKFQDVYPLVFVVTDREIEIKKKGRGLVKLTWQLEREGVENLEFGSFADFVHGAQVHVVDYIRNG